MPNLYVFAASNIECGPVLKAIGRGRLRGIEGKATGKIGPNEILLFKTGMGPDCARGSAANLLEARPKADGSGAGARPADAVIVTGFAGGLANDLKEGDVVIYSSCRSIEEGEAPAFCSPVLSARLMRALSRLCSPKVVMGVSSSTVAVNPAEKSALAGTGASAVDMESYEIVSAANHAGLPAAVLRVISDSRDRTIPDFNRALNGEGGFNPIKLGLVCASHPVATWRLFRASRRATAVLGRVLGAALTVDIQPLIAAESSVESNSVGAVPR